MLIDLNIFQILMYLVGGWIGEKVEVVVKKRSINSDISIIVTLLVLIKLFSKFTLKFY